VTGAARRASAVAALVASTVVGVAAQTAPDDDLARVRAALEKPASKLTLQPRTPDFRVNIEKRRPMQDIFDVPPWATDPVGWQPPGIGFDLLSAVRYVAHNIAEVKRARDLRLAREEVGRAVADFCAAQTAAADDRTAADPQRSADQLCSSPPASR
jgi:hypothetical protein